MRFLTLFLALIVWVQASAYEIDKQESLLPNIGPKDAYTPAVAYGKDVFLVVWKSGHLAEGDLREGLKFDTQIVGCRIDKNGRMLDSAPFVIANAADLREHPQISFSGNVFLVVWQDLKNGKDWDVYGARVTPEGKVLDAAGIAIAALPHSQALPAVAWDGKNFLVVWQDFRSGSHYEIFGTRVSVDGKVSESIRFAEPANNSRSHFYGPCVAGSFDGNQLLFWLGVSQNSLANCQLVKDGVPVGTPTYTQADWRKAPGGGNSTFPCSLEIGENNYLLTWTTDRPMARGNTGNDANGAIFDKNGVLVKSLVVSGIAPPPWSFPQRIRNPHAAWDGKSFIVVWDQTETGKPLLETVCANAISASGEPSTKVIVSGSTESPCIKPCVASDRQGLSIMLYEKHPDKPEIPIRIGFHLISNK